MDIEASACAHFSAGEVEPSTAAADPMAAVADESTAMLGSHIQYDVALLDGASYLAFASEGGATHILLSDVATVRLRNSDGDAVPLEEHGSSDTCSPLDAWFSADLAAGTYTIVIEGPAGDLGLLIED
jgi:hypothetical protein